MGLLLSFLGIGSRTVLVQATSGYQESVVVPISYCEVTRLETDGRFGKIYTAKLIDTGEKVVIKKVVVDRNNNELQIMNRLQHKNIVKLKYYFCSAVADDWRVLNLVMEYFPETLHSINMKNRQNPQIMPLMHVKLYVFQLFEALAYIHSQGICHSDIKPQNILIKPETKTAKVCDFGSAIYMAHGAQRIGYICSRFYRAPEIILESSHCSYSIDTWSAGCILGELLAGRVLFHGKDRLDQFIEIIKIFGTPTNEQFHHLNPDAEYSTLSYMPDIKGRAFANEFPKETSLEGIQLTRNLLSYSPEQRPTPKEACDHAFFYEVRQEISNVTDE